MKEKKALLMFVSQRKVLDVMLGRKDSSERWKCIYTRSDNSTSWLLFAWARYCRTDNVNGSTIAMPHIYGLMIVSKVSISARTITDNKDNSVPRLTHASMSWSKRHVVKVVEDKGKAGKSRTLSPGLLSRQLSTLHGGRNLRSLLEEVPHGQEQVLGTALESLPQLLNTPPLPRLTLIRLEVLEIAHQ